MSGVKLQESFLPTTCSTWGLPGDQFRKGNDLGGERSTPLPHHTPIYANGVPQDGAGDARETNHGIQGLGLWAMWYQHHLWGWGLESGLCGQWFTHSYLHNRTPIKSLDTEADWVSLAVLNQWARRVRLTESTEALCVGTSQTSSCVTFLSDSDLYPFTIWNCNHD